MGDNGSPASGRARTRVRACEPSSVEPTPSDWFIGFVEIEIEIVEIETRFETLNSLWVLRPGEYCRLPKTEAPRAPHASAALADGMWVSYDRVWLVRDPEREVAVLRILPTGRPPGSYGVHTSDLVAIPTVIP